MTDRADEIARSICTNLTSAGALEGADPYTERMVLDALRAYGDECRNAALEEAAERVTHLGTPSLAAAIRALKEKP